MYNIYNSYDIREDLKSVGGTFNASSKAWVISDAAFAKLDARTQSWGMKWIRGWDKAQKERVGTVCDLGALDIIGV